MAPGSGSETPARRGQAGSLHPREQLIHLLAFSAPTGRIGAQDLLGMRQEVRGDWQLARGTTAHERDLNEAPQLEFGPRERPRRTRRIRQPAAREAWHGRGPWGRPGRTFSQSQFSYDSSWIVTTDKSCFSGKKVHPQGFQKHGMHLSSARLHGFPAPQEQVPAQAGMPEDTSDSMWTRY
jgi:hypothetical protein